MSKEEMIRECELRAEIERLRDIIRGLMRVCPAERHGMILPEYQAAREALKRPLR